MPLSWLAVPVRRRVFVIPSLVDGQEIDPTRMRVRAYPVREQDGLDLDLHGRAGPREPPRRKANRPKRGSANAKPRWVESQTFACNIDHAVIGLMDPRMRLTCMDAGGGGSNRA